ncbi:flavodoxin family protein [Chloroflexota bacterium]
MSGDEKVLGLVGSPNRDGLTNQLVSSALKGVERAGATTELVQMSDYIVEACRDCLPWVCAENLKCTYNDENLEILSQKILDCNGLILGTPVYWGDTSAMVRYLFIKILRIYARSGPLWGLPAFGIAIAGGSGNGLISGLRPIYHFFRTMRFRAIDPLPVTRFNLESSKEKAEKSGYQLAEMIKDRRPFETRDECLLWYDRLPYLGYSHADERRLLAAITSEAVPEDKKRDINGDLTKVEILAASGRTLESVNEIATIYDSCIEILSKKAEQSK